MTRCRGAAGHGCQDARMPPCELSSARERERQMWGCLRLATSAAALSLALLPGARGAVVEAAGALPTLLRLGLTLIGPCAAAALLIPAFMLAGRLPSLACGMFSAAGTVLALAVGCWFAPSEGLLEGAARWLGAFFTIGAVVEFGGELLELMSPAER